MNRRDKRYIEATLCFAPVAMYLTWGLLELIGSERFRVLAIAAFGLMVFFTIVLPLIECLILFFVMKIIERQNKGKP